MEIEQNHGLGSRMVPTDTEGAIGLQIRERRTDFVG